MDPKRHIFTVSELNAQAKEALEGGLGLVWLEGELSNLAQPSSGHWYFTLKDQRAQIKCAFFKMRNRLLNFAPEDGQVVLVRGRVSLYETRGDYQLIVDHMEPAGLGDLQKAFEQLKDKLNSKGYFDSSNKLPLPVYPRCIGVITSSTGAALKDIQNIHARRSPGIPIIVYPTQVQGESAADQIIAMLTTALSRQECDVLILARGGGSLEDLWPFNNEKLAEAIFNSPIPIVTGIGHEVDFTIADFVSDVRAPTPSAAIEMVTPDRNELYAYLNTVSKQLEEQIRELIRQYSQQLDWLEQKLKHFHPEKGISRHQENLAALNNRINCRIKAILNMHQGVHSQINKRLLAQSPASDISHTKVRIQHLVQNLVDIASRSVQQRQQLLSEKSHALNMASPLSTLSRGYSITTKHTGKNVVRHINELDAHDLIETRLIDGRILSRVESIHEDDT